MGVPTKGYVTIVIAVIIIVIVGIFVYNQSTMYNNSKADVYVLSGLNNTVFGINISSQNIFVIANNTFPQSIAIGSNGFGYISTGSNLSDGTIMVFDTTTNHVTKIINLSSNRKVLSSLAISPNNNRLYVSALNYSVNKISANTTSITANAFILVINTTTSKLTDMIPTGRGNPLDMALTPNGELLYVANINNRTVSVINTTTNKIIDNITVVSEPSSIAISPDGKSAYVSNVLSYADVLGTVWTIITLYLL